MPFPLRYDVPTVDTAQMIELDRLMIEKYGITLIQMMENAGRALAHLARARFLSDDPRGKRVAVLAGTGGNGGGALVCARRLHNYGARVQVVTAAEASRFTPVPAHQLGILDQIGIPVARAGGGDSAETPDLIIDGLIGYSLKGAPREPVAGLIRWANAMAAPVLALDAPSGLDTTTGTIFDPAVAATATLTLALPKRGLLGDAVATHVGELYLADISVPPALYDSPAFPFMVGPIFAESDILRLG